MAMTRAEIVTEVRQNIKRTSDAFEDSRIELHLDWVQRRIALVHSWEEMLHVYSGYTIADPITKRYTFPPRMKDFVSLKLIDGTNSHKLKYVRASRFDEEVPYPESTTGNPAWYVDFGTYFELYHIPDAVYGMEARCSIFPVDFTEDSSESDLLGKDHLLVAAATSTGFRALKEIEDADYWAGVAADMMSECRMGDHSAEDWQPVARPYRAGGVSIDPNSPFTGRV